jgi:hypothetical protein
LDSSSAFCLSYNGDGRTGRANRSAYASFARSEFDVKDDLYVGIAAGKPLLVATKAWPDGAVMMKGNWLGIAITHYKLPPNQAETQLMVGTQADLNDGRITLVAKDRNGKDLHAESAGTFSSDFWLRAGTWKAGAIKRTAAFGMEAASYKRLALVEVYWTPYQWVVFKDVALRPKP